MTAVFPLNARKVLKTGKIAIYFSKVVYYNGDTK